VADTVVRDESGLELVTGNSTALFGTDQVPKPTVSSPSRSVAVATAIGLGAAAISIAYFFLGSVRIEAGPRAGVRYRAETIWSDFAGYLVRQGVNSEFVFIIGALAVLSILGSCLLIGLAFAVRDDSTTE
jgi:hypothetical protein